MGRAQWHNRAEAVSTVQAQDKSARWLLIQQLSRTPAGGRESEATGLPRLEGSLNPEEASISSSKNEPNTGGILSDANKECTMKECWGLRTGDRGAVYCLGQPLRPGPEGQAASSRAHGPR